MPPLFRPRLARAFSLAALTACLCLPAGAHAATIGKANGVVTFTAAPGEANQVTVSTSGSNYVLRDITPGVTVSALAGCSWTAIAPTQATCPTSNTSRIDIDLGDGNDTLTANTSRALRVTGGPGDDSLAGGSGGDTFMDGGGPGADILSGGAGRDTADYSARTDMVALSNDSQPGDGAPGEGDNIASDIERLLGGAGDDLMLGGPNADELRGNNGADTFLSSPGADVFGGGSGTDVADFSARTEPLTIDLDNVADDGAAGELDNVGGDIDEVIGGSANDAITGHNSTNVLRGGAGNDALVGLDGNDTFDGGPGADSFAGGGGSGDTLDYSGRAGAVTITANAVADDGEAGEGDDVDDSVERLTGGSAADTIAAGANASTIDGGPGNDVIRGSAAGDTIDAGEGDDRMDGGAGADRLTGGPGTDAVDYSARTNGVKVDADGSRDDGEPGENDNVAVDVEHIVGGAGPDDLQGEDGDDVLEGGEGDDQLDGGPGADLMYGGGGRDYVDYSDRHEPVFVELDGEADDGALREGDFVAPDVESAEGGAGQDRLVGDANANELQGGDGDDIVVGGPGDDTLGGGEGYDQLDGGDGIDTMNGGEGEDLADYVSISASIRLNMGGGLDGGDHLIDVENVNGTKADDRLTGGEGDNRISGQGGDDKIEGGLGGDEIVGDNGTDTATYASRVEPVTVDNDGYADDGGEGEGDQVDVTVENIIGGKGNDSLTAATSARNDLRGREGDDTLSAGARDDVVHGHAGNDTIDGGTGADRLYSGEGNDRVVGGKGKDRIYSGPGRDDLDTKDGVADKVDCGPGRDTYRADKIDKLEGCEVRWKPKPPTRTPGTTPRPQPQPAPTFPPVRVEGSKLVRKRGKFVAIPGFPGERIDKRLLRDIRWMRARYHIFITDGYALHGHTPAGEHPRGLAIDIVPGPGGSWRDIDRLAKWAEPRQNRPRAPFRWVGYNGDANHGRGNHLHLSWNHAPTKRGKPASWVYVIDFARKERKKPSKKRPLERLAKRSDPRA